MRDTMSKGLYYIVKLIINIQKLGKGGTSFPGKFALSRKPDVLANFTLPDNRVFISGTNGKTSTANSLAKLFEQTGRKITHNAQGANMLQGITTTFFQKANSKYQIKSDHLIIEIDELTMPLVFKYVSPKSLIITNLFDDQIDRYGGKWALAKTLSEQLPKDITLYINGDDPTLIWLCQQLKPRKVIYFGLRKTELQKNKIDSSSNQEICPRCQRELHYEKKFYDSIGKFSCDCGFKSHELDYEAKDIDLENGSFNVNEQIYHMPYQQIYLIYNMLAVIAYASENGIKTKQISESLSQKINIAGRFEYLDFNEKQAWLNLVKNPAGLNQSLDFLDRELIKLEDMSANIFIAFNNKPADGLDTSWIKQSNFNLLKKQSVHKIYLAGDLKDEMAKVFSDLNFDKNKIVMIEHVEDIIKTEKQNSYQNYFISNFTMLNEVRNAIVK